MGPAVSAADDGDGGSGFAVETKCDRAEVGTEDTELSSCAQQETHGVRDQRTEVCHGADAHENQGRQDRPLIQSKEVVQKSARGSVRGLRHDIGIDIDEQHTERDRDEQKGLKSFCDCQIEKNKRDEDHQVVAPGQIKKRCLM